MIKKSVDEAVFDTILTQAFRDAAKEDMKDEALDKDFVPVQLTPEHLQIEQKAFKRYEARCKRQVSANRYAVLRRVVFMHPDCWNTRICHYARSTAGQSCCN